MDTQGSCTFHLRGEEIHLLSQRALWWPKEKSLLIADLHLGKSGHFRSHGIAVPSLVNVATLQRLNRLLNDFQPEMVIFMGDLFHSTYNKEWEAFKKVIRDFPVEYLLVQGNHDILPKEKYEDTGITLKKGSYPLSPFLLSHEPLTDHKGDDYVLAGHIHPGVRMRGMARQVMSLPCFFFGEKQGILPAFGDFTGLFIMEPREEDCLFAIVEEEILQVNGGSSPSFPQ